MKRIYGMRERQFRRFYEMAQQSSDLTGAALLQLLERRLDNIVFRMGWARTRPQARQMVAHGHVLVDGRRVNIPSYLVHPEQRVSLGAKAQRIPDVQASLEEDSGVPGWLQRDEAQGTILRMPQREEIHEPVDEQLVVEFYSR